MKIFLVIAMIGAIAACSLMPTSKKRAPAQAIHPVFGPGIQTRFSDLNSIKQFVGEWGDFQIKFVMLDYQKGGDVLFLQPDSYFFHDDWFLMKLFNGQKVPGVDLPPYANFQTESRQDLLDKLKALKPLPDGIIEVNGRIVADNFYKMSSGPDRIFGLGSIIYSYNSERTPAEIFAFDMVFNDEPRAEDVKIMHDRLSKALNTGNLKWYPRSQNQENLAGLMQKDPDWLKKIVYAKDFTVPGEIHVYSSSTVAGIPFYFPKGKYNPGQLTSESIVLLDELPDDLPPVKGIITSVPQTELSHINILARARGTLNVYSADSKQFDQLKARAEQKKPVAFALIDGKLKMQDLTSQEYTSYLQFFEKSLYSVPDSDASQYEYLYDLSKLKSWKPEQLIGVLGGKSAGMVRLLSTQGIPTPPKPQGLSIRAYREHLKQKILPLLKVTLLDPRFKSDAKLRYLVLEGPKKFEKLYKAEVQQAPYADLIAGKDTTALGQFVKARGVQNMIEDQALSPELEARLKSALTSLFPKLPRGQALRFRSSADVEDIPGFVGAGLYDSYSGYLDPNLQALTDEEKSDVWSKALKKTWASYWNYRAFEERELSKIDHLSGSMAVMIHPNFPEATEKANGVLTVSWEQSPFWKGYHFVINAHRGEKPVVRPEEGSPSLPQSITADFNATDGVVDNIEMKESSEGLHVLNKNQTEELIKMASKVFDSWLNTLNRDLKPEWRHTHYALDMEFKMVPAQWFKDFSNSGKDTLLIKQSRPLMKSQSLSSDLRALPIPRSLLNEATKIIRRNLDTEHFTFSTVEVYKANTRYDGAFNADADFRWKVKVGPNPAGSRTYLTHVDMTNSNHGFMHHGPWDLSFDLTPERQKSTGLGMFNAYENGVYSLTLADNTEISGSGLGRVKTDYLLTTADVWLLRLVCQKQKGKPIINIGDLKPGGGGKIGALDMGIGIGGGIEKGPSGTCGTL